MVMQGFALFDREVYVWMFQPPKVNEVYISDVVLSMLEVESEDGMN